MADDKKVARETYNIDGPQAPLVASYSAEGWQFFAFVFAAVVTLAFALTDEWMIQPGACRALVKLGLFVGFGYFTLYNKWCKAVINKALPAVKEKARR